MVAGSDIILAPTVPVGEMMKLSKSERRYLVTHTSYGSRSLAA